MFLKMKALMIIGGSLFNKNSQQIYFTVTLLILFVNNTVNFRYLGGMF
jgi:hypothetical protein